MKGTVRIIAGSMRGRVIPFLNGKFNDADITPQKVKGALFSMLGERLDGKVFVDLYAGSGQIGFEALSRGADTVVINEADRLRFTFIKDFAALACAGNMPVLLNMKAAKALEYLSEHGIKADVIYADPPYEKIKGEAGSYIKILESAAGSGLLSETGIVIVQHFSANDLPDSCCGFTLISLKKYGTTSLSVFRILPVNSNQPG